MDGSRPGRGARRGRGSCEPKLPFDLDEMLRRIGEAVRPFPPAALFGLAERGHSTVFELLVACIISIRTLDETTLPTALGLFAAARTPEAMAALPEAEIDRLISASTFHPRKAAQIRAIARQAAEAGGLPCDSGRLMALPGVGIKCANLVAGIACGLPRVSVDVHVHRVTNRWGYLRTSTPERSTEELEARLPERHKVALNRLLVPFGKHLCTRLLPRCSVCPVLAWCRQVGVGAHR